MFYLNHDNIEGLIREAAKNYHVNTDKAFDWDRIDNAIHDSEDNKNEPPESEKKKKRRFIFWGLLFMSIALFSYNIWNAESGKKLLQKNVSGENISRGNNKKDNNDIINLADNIPNKTKSRETTNNRESNSKEGNNIISAAGNSISTTKSAPQIDINKSLTYVVELADNKQANNFFVNKSVVKKKKQLGFYTGLLVAPDFTFVKFQKINGIGITFGLIGGYNIDSKWSIENGVLLDTKKYYTEGEYFDKRNVPDFANVSFLSINGSC